MNGTDWAAKIQRECCQFEDGKAFFNTALAAAMFKESATEYAAEQLQELELYKAAMAMVCWDIANEGEDNPITTWPGIRDSYLAGARIKVAKVCTCPTQGYYPGDSEMNESHCELTEEEHERISDAIARSSKARPGVGNAVESNSADEKECSRLASSGDIDARLDRAWIDGANVGWNLAIADNPKRFCEAIKARHREIIAASREKNSGGSMAPEVTRDRDDLSPEQRKRSYESKHGAGSWERDHGELGRISDKARKAERQQAE